VSLPTTPGEKTRKIGPEQPEHATWFPLILAQNAKLPLDKLPNALRESMKIYALYYTPKKIRPVLYAVFSKNAFWAYILAKNRAYLTKNRAYLTKTNLHNLPSMRCRLSPAERALGSRPYMGVPAAAAGCLLPTTKTKILKEI
jgi:hypothetical protein